MNNFSDEQIVNSWQENAMQWVSAIRGGEVESRVLVTNKAIVNAVLEREPKTVLDIGCGEGWLVRELGQSGISCLGIDVVSELIASAKKEGGGRFIQIAYENLSYERLKEKFDVVVCNFSLLGNESVSQVFSAVSGLLNESGSFIVQTIHPVAGCGDEQTIDGWREGSWAGFNQKFRNPAPWYFRTLASWETMFINHGFRLIKKLEPFNRKINAPASVIFVAVC